MKKLVFFIGFAFVLGMTSSAFSAGFAPEVVVDPFDPFNKVVKLEVGSVVGDGSWMWLPLTTPIDTSVHKVVTVSFDIYTDSIGENQQLAWGWVDQNDQWSYNTQSFKEGSGLQERYGPDNVYPFLWNEYADYHANTVFGDYATLEIQWDFENRKASAWYDGSAVLLNGAFHGDTPLIDTLYGYDISLNNTYGPDGDIIYIDNFMITGSEIYDSLGFQNFALGSLNGQDGWIATSGDGQPVPLPATMVLFGFGLAVLAGIRKKILC